ncbi:MAG: redoxin domain-containing protein [Planctomycetaceae bacterium]|nr:redoxin domain-containing protein [Planctomycetaceae bacterium]
MRAHRRVSLVFVGLALAATSSFAAEKSIVGRTVENFALKDFRGQPHQLADVADKKLIVLAVLGTECPLAKLYGPRLAQLAADYEPKGVAFLGLSPNQQDSVTELAAYARVHNIHFPLLKDLGNVVADQIGATRTPEVFVLDGERKVVYAGRIDDQYGFEPSGVGYQLDAPKRRDLAEALDELLAGKPVSQPEITAQGCLIGRVRTPDPASKVTFNEVAVVLNKNCVECHRAGQLAPFSLSKYDEVVGWADMIVEVIDQGRMPPWHADPKFGKFVNDCRLSDAERDVIHQWVAAGAPEGDPSKLPPAPTFVEGWQIGQPDQIIYMRDEPFDVPAEGTVPYQSFVVDPGWTEDKWIKAIEPKAGNPAVVHHVVMFLVPPEGPKTGATSRLRTDWLASFAPGLRMPILPDHLARFVPKGSKLLFQMHYTPNGVAQSDRSYLGVVFADPQKVQKEVAVKNAGNFTFRIPAGADHHEVESTFAFREDSLLISLSPHMHVRGKDFVYNAVMPDGTVETLLSVPRYDFAWQTTYILSEPKLMPKGSKLHCVAHFDNSENNLNNPDPTVEVRWGEQTWEEMMFGWFEMALVDQDLTKPQPPRKSRVEEFQKLAEAGGAIMDEQLKQVAAKGLEKDEDFKFFAYYLKDLVPQIDRVCITTVADGNLRAKHVEEIDGLKTTLRTTNTVIKAEGQMLAEVLGAEKPVVVEDLSTAKGSVVARMHNKGVQSSLHIPATLGGQKVTVNFWSTEPKGFPPAAVALLEQVVQDLVRGR